MQDFRRFKETFTLVKFDVLKILLYFSSKFFYVCVWQLSQKHIVHSLRQFKESFMVLLIDCLYKKTLNLRKLIESEKICNKKSQKNCIEKSLSVATLNIILTVFLKVTNKNNLNSNIN